MRPVLLTAASFNFFHAWLFAVFTVFALRVLGFSPFLLGVVLTVSALFGILGAALAPRLITWLGPGRSVIVAFVLIGASAATLPFLGVMGQGLAAATTTIVFGLWDFAVTVAVIVGDSARQTLLPDDYRSRAAGTERFATWGLDPIGALAGGAVASTAFGLTGSVAIAALGMLVPAVLAICSSGLWRLHELPDDEAAVTPAGR
jgi:predicted MFS family arabinose efflux permease